MFDLGASDLAKPKISMDHYQEWAGEIANSYFNSGVEPTATLKKIAQSEDLTPHQVEVLAGETNKLIHTKKFASADEKYFAADFPLADAQKALGELQRDGTEEKVAAEVPEPVFKDQGPDPFDMFGVEEAKEHAKVATTKQSMKTASSKLNLMKQKIDDKILMLKHAKIIKEKEFIKQARQALLEDSSSEERAKTLGKFAQFVENSGLDQGKPVLAKLAYVMAKDGKLEPSVAKKSINYFMDKTADEKAPPELVSEDMKKKTRVINGKHPLYITLKTIGDCEAELLRYERESQVVDDKLRLLNQKIRAL